MDNVKSDVMLSLWDAFKQEGIRVPYPVREIRVPRRGPSRSRASSRFRVEKCGILEPVHRVKLRLACAATIIKLGRSNHPPEPSRTMSYIEATDASLRKTGQIKLHGPGAFAGMRKGRRACFRNASTRLTDLVKPGPTRPRRSTTSSATFAFSHGAYPATLMYRGYRYSTCTSINHVVCHGMPGDRGLKEGDNRQHRRHLHRRRLVRRFQPDVCGRPDCAKKPSG